MGVQNLDQTRVKQPIQEHACIRIQEIKEYRVVLQHSVEVPMSSSNCRIHRLKLFFPPYPAPSASWWDFTPFSSMQDLALARRFPYRQTVGHVLLVLHVSKVFDRLNFSEYHYWNLASSKFLSVTLPNSTASSTLSSAALPEKWQSRPFTESPLLQAWTGVMHIQ